MEFPGCPAKHYPDELDMWLEWYRWLTVWNKTPADFGLKAKHLDPRYAEAMELIHWAMATYEKKPAT